MSKFLKPVEVCCHESAIIVLPCNNGSCDCSEQKRLQQLLACPLTDNITRHTTVGNINRLLQLKTK
jgi:hypothetical protein